MGRNPAALLPNPYGINFRMGKDGKCIMKENLSKLTTEQCNPNTREIDRADSLEIARLINNEDQFVPLAVQKELPQIARAIDLIVEQLRRGGRLFYCGAGTSGRLGVLDASECPPTYGVEDGLVVGLIAGGERALLHAVENAEDSLTLCEQDLKAHQFTAGDILVGIAASGRTPYVIGGMQYAKSIGAPVISLCCSPESAMAALADVAITPVTGPEAVTGSTRMKAGTAQKLVLNMLSSGAMIRMGKVYGNLMVDVQPTNAKLVERARRMVMQATEASYEDAAEALAQAGQNPKTAIVMLLLHTDAADAKARLAKADGRIRDAL